MSVIALMMEAATRELLRLNRNQLTQVTGLLTGQCHLKCISSNWELPIAPPADVIGKMKQLHMFYVIVRP
jgi:CheY-specific phosphatase CheX